MKTYLIRNEQFQFYIGICFYPIEHDLNIKKIWLIHGVVMIFKKKEEEACLSKSSARWTNKSNK